VRAATAVVVGLASAAAVGTAWQSGLHPTAPVLGAARIVPPVRGTTSAAAAPPATGPTTSRPAKKQKHAAGSPPTPRRSTATATATRAPSAVPRVVDGPMVQTQYGGVQVAVTYVGHRILDVKALHLTDSSDTSVSISSQAAPMLRQEALSAQSARIDMISGASYTSAAYVQSLQAALDAAHV
jgi:uncharacterized protein with FMN-binding domain